MNEVANRFDFVVRWEPFLLRPDTPAEGVPLPAAYTDLSNPRVAHLKQAGEAAGVDFTFKAKWVPSTVQTHALLEFAKSWDGGKQQNNITEKLFKMRFSDGSALSEQELVSVAEEFGLPSAEVKDYITNPQTLETVKEKALEWSRKGINGVPFFYMNGNRMFSGAQDKEVFKRMFDIAAEKFPLSTPSKS